ncbi:MATE family efflux transporter [Saprospiraceae bacterium]|nr:MATE family efflux transporter [Saprospiraceae bacterium]
MKYYKEIFALSIPNILSNISIPLISSVDTGLMGHLSAKHLAAVGSSAMIFNFLYWNFGFLRMGTTGLVAQAHGRKDEHEKSRSFLQAVLVALSIAALLLLLQKPLASISFQLMNLDGELLKYAKDYFSVRIWDAPGTLLLYILMAWFFGNQNAIVPLILTIIINVTNIAFSYYFVKVLGLGIQGVAYGTLISTYTGIIVGFIFLFKKHPVISIPFSELSSGLQRFWKLNRDIFLRTVMLSITFAFLYSMAARYGTIALAINVIVLQFTNWMSYAVDGFAYASESLVGKYVGAKDDHAVKKTINGSMICGAILALLFSIIYALFYREIAQIFTSDLEVLVQLRQYRWWLVIIPLVGFASYIWDGVFVGLTASKAMRNTMAVSFVVYLATYFLTEDYLGYSALLLALCMYLLSRGIAQTVVYLQKGTALQ